MDLDVDVFALPKDGASEDEYEDAHFPSAHERVVADGFACAVADGATESSFSGLWARLLVTHFGRESTSLDFQPIIDAAAIEWHSQVATKALPWYAQQKVAQGAFAALLGVRLTDALEDDRLLLRYEARAIGDSCLFHVRGDSLLLSFPFTSSLDFSSSPSLVATEAEANALNKDYAALGECYTDDLLLLATDSLAKCLLAECERRKGPWSQLRNLNTEEEPTFREMVEEYRRSGSLRNDDCTLVRVNVL